MQNLNRERWILALVKQLGRLIVLGSLAILSLVACDSPGPDSATEAVQQRLVGSWLRDYEQDGAHVRRLLVLSEDGHFSETAQVTTRSGTTTEHSNAGEWLYDGTNLKRKYLNSDGKPMSRLTLPFATFALRFESNREFVGVDNLHKLEVRYQRVEPGTVL